MTASSRIAEREDHSCSGGAVHRCVRPACAVHMTDGHNALRESGPGQQLAFDHAMAHVGVLIAGSTGTALRAVRPPNLQVTPLCRRDFGYAASAAGSL